MTFSDQIQKAQQLANAFTRQQNKILIKHAEWDGDVRVAVFSRIAHSLQSAHLSMLNYQSNVNSDDFWERNISPRLTRQQIDTICEEYNRFNRVAFSQSIFSIVESTLRLVLRALDSEACIRGTEAFESIYRCLFLKLDLKKHEPLLKLLRIVRNTSHNNGVYFHKSGTNDAVEYQGVDYRFIHGQAIDFTNWPWLLERVAELEAVLVDVVDASYGVGIARIEDPFSKRFPPPSI